MFASEVSILILANTDACKTFRRPCASTFAPRSSSCRSASCRLRTTGIPCSSSAPLGFRQLLPESRGIERAFPEKPDTHFLQAEKLDCSNFSPKKKGAICGDTQNRTHFLSYNPYSAKKVGEDDDRHVPSPCYTTTREGGRVDRRNQPQGREVVRDHIGRPRHRVLRLRGSCNL